MLGLCQEAGSRASKGERGLVIAENLALGFGVRNWFITKIGCEGMEVERYRMIPMQDEAVYETLVDEKAMFDLIEKSIRFW